MECPALVANVNTPKLMWYQTDTTVVIRILLTDVVNYYLRVENDHLLFNTITGGKKYYLCLYLFGPVVAERTQHKNVEREIKVHLIKELKWYQWLRLTLSKEKNIFITRDPDHLGEKDYATEEEARKDFILKHSNQEYKRRISEMEFIKPVDSSTEEENSDDEDQLDFMYYS